MMAVLSTNAVWVFMLGIVLYGMAKKVDCVNACIQGAEKGFHAYLRVLPTMLCMLSAIAVARHSGLSWMSITGLPVPLANWNPSTSRRRCRRSFCGLFPAVRALALLAELLTT